MIELTARCLLGKLCPFRDGKFCPYAGCWIAEKGVCLPTSVSAHEQNLRRLRCVVTQAPQVTLHHCRGGSMRLTPFGTPGVSQKQNPALQIPLTISLHVLSPRAIDGGADGVNQWETNFGTQVEHLNSISAQLQYSVWALAWKWASRLSKARVESYLRASRSRFHLP